MALALYDRVQETTTTAGTGSLTLLGAVNGFQSFAVVGDTNTCYYTIVDGNAWEVGIGTYSTTGPTLARTTILSNSDSTTSPITLSSSANTKAVFLTYPAEKSVNLNAAGNVSPLGTISSGTWQGSTVGVAYGGTGVTSSSGPNSVVLRDSNETISVHRVNQGVAVTASSGGTLALDAASAYWQTITGTSSHTVQLPNATTVPVGSAFVIDNDSTQAISVVDYASGPIDTVPAGGYTYVFLEINGTVAGTWNRAGFIPSQVNWGTNSLDLGGTTVVSNGTWQGNAVQPGYGGTGLTTFTGANNALYSTGASTLTAGTLPVLAGGTGATSDSGARSNLGAAASGANSDITSLSGLTTPLSVGQGGTGLSSVTQYRIPYGNGTSAFNTSVNFTYDGTYLLVGSLGGLGGATNPVIASVGTANNYVQSYVYNTQNGTSASADLVAYPSNGSDASGWADLGVTSLTYSDAAFSVTGPNEAYLFGSSPSAAGSSVTGNLVYATDSYGSANAHQWYVGGFNQAKSAWKMQLNASTLTVKQTIESTSGGFKFPDGTTQTTAASGNAYTRTSFNATAGQTTFSVTYTVGYVEVFVNGVLLNGSDYTATNGTSVVLSSAAALNDVVEFIAYSTQPVSIVTADDIAGGSAGQVVYQTGAGATGFVTNGTAGQILYSNGSSSPYWDAAPSMTYPSSGIAVSTGSAWGTSKTSPTGDVVGTTDTQTLSAKTITGLKETKVAIAAVDIDLSAGNYFSKTITTTTAFTASNVPTTGTAASFILDLTNGGSQTVTFMTGIKWAGGTPPTLTASGRDVLGFFTYDAGTTWNGFVLGKAMA